MARVPRNRNTRLERLRSGRQKAIIVGGVPIPAGEDSFPGRGREGSGLFGAEVRDEVHCQPELVRALERSRFRDAFLEQVSLPHGRAVALEDFEAGLRAAGLVGVDEILVQSGTTGRKFRVAKRHVRIDGHLNTPELSKDFPGGNALNNSAVVTGGEGRSLPRVPHSKLGRRPRF